MFKYSYFIILCCTFLSSCQSQEPTNPQNHASSPINDSIDTFLQYQLPTIDLSHYFTPIDSSYTHKTLLLPEGFVAQVLFSEKLDWVVTANGKKAPAKGNHDLLVFIPNPSNQNEGELLVSHETKYADSILGDGGGATIFKLKKNDQGRWERIGDFEHIDFNGVGNTDRNCGGVSGPNGLVYSCEEYCPMDNKTMYRDGKGHQKTDSVGNLDYWQNIGYVVEIDPKTRKATQKMIGMGRYFHEDLEFMDDQKTVYLSDDYEPGVLFKFVAYNPLDYAHGQLYAYQLKNKNEAGTWIPLPRDTATMIRARDAAIELGATMFMRHEWVSRVGNKIYIAETGHDHTDWSKRVASGGIPSPLLPQTLGNNIYEDTYGRILVLDTETNTMSTLIEGGFNSDSTTCFSNPDCIEVVKLGNKDYLLIHEDINKNTKGRVSTFAEKKNHYYCELFFLDLSIENPTVNDLKRFAIAPMNAEFTGGIFSPDGSTLFLNIQHPHPSSDAPYQQSVTVAIYGFDKP